MPDIRMTEYEESQRNPNSIEVDIDASKISGVQQNIPLMLEVPNSSNSELNVVAFGDHGEQLPTEIEGIANDKNWVHLSNTVQSIINQRMKIFYGGTVGKPVADSTYGSEAVWGNFAIYHMNQDPNTAGSNGILDSTANINHGTPDGFASGKLINGDYGYAIDFDAAQKITIPDMDYSSQDISIIVKFKRNRISVAGNTDRIIMSIDVNGFGVYMKTDNTFAIGKVGVDEKLSTTTISDTTSYHVVGITTNGTNAKHFLDASLDRTQAYTSTFNTSNSYTIGSRGSAEYLDGIIEEVRVFQSTITDNYMMTTHKNLNNPTSAGSNPFYKSITKELNYVQTLKSLGRAG